MSMGIVRLACMSMLASLAWAWAAALASLAWAWAALASLAWAFPSMGKGTVSLASGCMGCPY